MISRTTQSLLGAVGVLALAVGIAEVHPPTGQAAAPGATVRTAVSHSTRICPPPLQGATGSTVYSLAVPGVAAGASPGGAASGNGTAALSTLVAPPSAAPTPSGSASASASAAPSVPASPAAPPALVKQTALGGTTTFKGASGDKAPALLGDAGGSTAPGFTVQQTTTGPGRAISGIACSAPGTDFWFAAADAAKGSTGYVELSNAEATAADVDLQIIGTSGEAETAQANNLAVPAGSTVSLLLSTLLSPGNDTTALAVHVIVRTGRVGAALHEDTGAKGADWLPATTLGSSQIIPGLPGDLSDATLVLAVPGAADADLKVQLASQNGWITPAGHETVHVKAGMATSVPLGALTHGQPAAMRLVPSDPKQASAFVAGIQVVRGSDTGYLAGSVPIGQRATAAGNANADSTLLLSASETAAVVKVSAIGDGGTPASTNVAIQAGATVAVPVKGPGTVYAVTVEPVSGGPVYAARMISRGSAAAPSFTIQTLVDDRSTVQIPRALQDDAILLP